MQLVNGFEVKRPVEEVWPILIDIERLITCIPGASLRGHEGDTYRGAVAVKIGPVSLKFEGAAEIVAIDHQARTMSLRGRARERGGQGNVEALITMSMADAGAVGTAVTVRTDLDLGGKVAQFGAGMIEKVSGRIIKQFVARLDAQLAGDGGAGGAPKIGKAVTDAGSPSIRRAAGEPAGQTDVLVPALSLVIAAVGAFLLGFASRRALGRSRSHR